MARKYRDNDVAMSVTDPNATYTFDDLAELWGYTASTAEARVGVLRRAGYHINIERRGYYVGFSGDNRQIPDTPPYRGELTHIM